MAVFYRKYQEKREGNKNFGKWYGRSVILNTVSTKDLASEISHATTVTYADVLAVLAGASEAMKQHLQNSQKVVLDGIGAFKNGVLKTYLVIVWLKKISIFAAEFNKKYNIWQLKQSFLAVSVPTRNRLKTNKKPF